MVVLDSPRDSSTVYVNLEESSSSSLSMANYLHCNSCYFRPGMGVQQRFYITNCSHIYCESCVTAATKDKCKVCKSQCSTLCLSGKIPKEVESMFLDPVESFQKYLKEFFQRLEFQKSHQRRLMRHMTEQLKSAEKKMGEVNKMIQRAQQLEREYFDLKSQNDYLKLLLSKKDGYTRGSSRSATSPSVFHASPSQTNAAFGKNPNFTSLQHRQGGGTNILPQTGTRLLIRTPPSGGRLGTVGGTGYTPSPTATRINNHTPQSRSGTPLTIPRPIQFNKND